MRSVPLRTTAPTSDDHTHSISDSPSDTRANQLPMDELLVRTCASLVAVPAADMVVTGETLLEAVVVVGEATTTPVPA